MNALKLILAAVIIAVIYFVLSDNLPDEVVFNGHLLDVKEDKSTANNNQFEIFTYTDQSGLNLIMIITPKRDAITLSALEQTYLERFKQKGFKFTGTGGNHVGIKDKNGLYLTIAPDINALVAYIERTSGNYILKPEKMVEIFSDLKNIKI